MGPPEGGANKYNHLPIHEKTVSFQKEKFKIAVPVFLQVPHRFFSMPPFWYPESSYFIYAEPSEKREDWAKGRRKMKKKGKELCPIRFFSFRFLESTEFNNLPFLKIR